MTAARRHFAVTSPERHRALVGLVDRLRDALVDSCDGEWAWIADVDDLRLIEAAFAGRNDAICDGMLSREGCDEVAAAVGQHIDGCWLPEEPDWRDPTVQHELAKHFIGTGEWIWYDEETEREFAAEVERNKVYGIRIYRYDAFPCGPITLEEHERRRAARAERLRTGLLGVARRNVQ